MKYLLAIFLVFLPYVKGEDCLWNRDTDFPEYPSLLMNEATWQSYLPVLEGTERVIRVCQGASIVIACPGSTISATGTEVAEGVCAGGTYVTVDGKNYDMKDLGCESRVSETLASLSGSCGNDNDGVYICFDPDLEITIYTKHLLRGESVKATDSNPSRPSFKSSSGIYSVSPNTCYEIDSQKTLMKNILGDSSVIDDSNSYYFARGHLSPDADFNTEMESDATYYYVNAVPQVANYQQWKFQETAIRDLAASHQTDFQIWTGPYDILELDDTDGDPVICELSTNKCLGVITSNNPYIDSFPDPICDDICNEISWIDFDVNDLTRGAVYCCKVQDLHAAIPDAPNISGAGLLDN
ncbi:hypothetical protein Anas_11620 [Armadillidium nasatum]|uniref:DNA/RNA non-specific endonuclease/pyrophosphatase/phosphodiesterase domain-containing protein n=1 Tax=Armadillidium nasatum TaxID=96803 RepID=A0A5N5TD00_9CRUS|nr:hypothetical protein Anas_11620 [Armadillidium nasatum]